MFLSRFSVHAVSLSFPEGSRIACHKHAVKFTRVERVAHRPCGIIVVKYTQIMTVRRGDQVLVRTHGGYPRVRRIWEIVDGVCVVVEDQWFEALERGELSYAVSFPLEDVFKYAPGMQINPRAPFSEWGLLERAAQ